MGGHTVVSKLLLTSHTGAEKDRYLPKMATGEIRATWRSRARGAPTCSDDHHARRER